MFFILNREDFSFVIHLDRQPRTSRRREAQTGSRARRGSRSERTLDAVEHSRTLMEWWPFLIFHRGGLRIKVINNTGHRIERRTIDLQSDINCLPERSLLGAFGKQHDDYDHDVFNSAGSTLATPHFGPENGVHLTLTKSVSAEHVELALPEVA